MALTDPKIKIILCGTALLRRICEVANPPNAQRANLLQDLADAAQETIQLGIARLDTNNPPDEAATRLMLASLYERITGLTNNAPDLEALDIWVEELQNFNQTVMAEEASDG